MVVKVQGAMIGTGMKRDHRRGLEIGNRIDSNDAFQSPLFNHHITREHSCFEVTRMHLRSILDGSGYPISRSSDELVAV
jgi:hypothetical protein